MAAMREAAYAPGLVTGRDKVGDQCLETGCKMAGDRDRPRRGRNRDHAAATVYRGAIILRIACLRRPSFPRLPRAMVSVVRLVRAMRVAHGVGAMMLGIMTMVMVEVMIMMVMPGFRWDRSGQKNGGRCE